MSRLTPGIVAAIMVSGSVIYMAANRLKQPDSSLFRLCKDFKLVSIVSASEGPSTDSPKPLQKPKKKVRFSDTVVELRADELAPRRDLKEDDKPKNKSGDKNRRGNPEEGILTMAENDAHIKTQPQEDQDDSEPQLSKSRSKKVEALLGANLPPNRLALYCNMYHDRLLKV